jgi:hypothetical protein
MSNIYKTAKGADLDLNQLKLNNEHVIAVGNAGVNARGDVVDRGRVVKTREQVMQETYNIRGSTVVQDAKSKIRTSANAISADKLSPPVINNTPEVSKPVQTNTIASTLEADIIVPADTAVVEETTDVKPRGGLADAINRSKEISEKLDEKRKRI